MFGCRNEIGGYITSNYFRAAPAIENVCKASEEAYRQARASGKSSKIASLISAKTFYVEFFDSKIRWWC